MKDTGTLISGIYYKIKLLVENNALLTKEIERFEHQNSELKNELEISNKKYTQIKEELDVMRITKTISLDDDKVNTKTIINELVREIDKSLNLLNK